MIGHSYALGIEVAGFMIVLILFMMILFLRFSNGKNMVLIFAPLAFGFDLPALLPVGCGLLSSAVSALPAAGGVIIYLFRTFYQSTVSGSDGNWILILWARSHFWRMVS